MDESFERQKPSRSWSHNGAVVTEEIDGDENGIQQFPARILADSDVVNLLPQPEDVWIAVMGVTGAGKSTFISLVTDDAVSIGHGLQSTTRELGIYRCKSIFSKTVWLIDTPGFDDTARPEVEILQENASYLANLYSKGILLSGLIYLHRITDPRMSGSAMKNLQMLKRLCGERAFPIVWMVSTRWDELEPQAARARESQLLSSERYWKPLLDGGGQSMQHHSTVDSTKAIVASILQKERKLPLAIQVEMVDQHKTLSNTSAGSFLEEESAQMKRKYEMEIQAIRESKEDALRERNKDATAALEMAESEYQKKLEGLKKAQRDLGVSLQELRQQKRAELDQALWDGPKGQSQNPLTGASPAAVALGNQASSAVVGRADTRTSPTLTNQQPKRASGGQVVITKGGHKVRTQTRETPVFVEERRPRPNTSRDAEIAARIAVEEYQLHLKTRAGTVQASGPPLGVNHGLKLKKWVINVAFNF